MLVAHHLTVLYYQKIKKFAREI